MNSEKNEKKILEINQSINQSNNRTIHCMAVFWRTLPTAISMEQRASRICSGGVERRVSTVDFIREKSNPMELANDLVEVLVLLRERFMDLSQVNQKKNGGIFLFCKKKKPGRCSRILRLRVELTLAWQRTA